MSLLSTEDAKRVQAAIERAEARSAGELVVAVVRRSAPYAVPRMVMTVAWTLAAALLARHHFADLSCRWVVLSQIPIGFVLWQLFGLPPFLRLLAGRDTEGAVRARAMQMFAERGVYNTRDRSGLLIMVSELEHRVVILGDRGIDAQVGTPGWEHQVRRLVQGIRQRRLGESLVEVVDDLGSILAAHFPRRADDINELPNQVIRDV